MSDLPPEIDASRPHSARVYDYLIGGENNFAVDRATAAKVLARSPNARTAPRENRAFLGRAVRFLTAEAGLWQFLDIGAGLPTANNLHQVAGPSTSLPPAAWPGAPRRSWSCCAPTRPRPPGAGS